jgi:CHAT domain-containing protein
VPAISGELPPLLATHEIVTLPSITALATIRQEKHKIGSSNKIVAVLADPVFTSNDDRVDNGEPHSATAFSGDQSQGQPALRNFESLGRNGGPMRLVHASEEADAIFAATPRGTGMVAKGFDASRQTAMSSLIAEYRIVHFATHAFLNSEHPELSGIVLNMVNQDGSKTNGFMPLQDIYNLNLSADLIVLSACDTALGKDIRGEGLVGLTRSFMSAGSRSVVASLWKVDDRATAVLMADFYKAMLHDGLPPAAALRSAKQKIRQEKAWSAPYFWAGFVLQGEYNERIVVERKSWLGIASAVSLALVVIPSGLLILRRRRRTHLARP